jgi:DNA invertase Pin-like site-specific DNA recombinase
MHLSETKAAVSDRHDRVPSDGFDTYMRGGLEMAQHRQVLGYIQGNSSDQNHDRLEAIGDVDRIFAEKLSGGTRSSRVALEECIRYVRDGNLVRVASRDRVARSMPDPRSTNDELLARRASVEVVKEGQTSRPAPSKARANLMLSMVALIAEFERELARERRAEGIQLAKTAGKHRGRLPRPAPNQLDAVCQVVDVGMSKAEVARRFSIARSTMRRVLVATTER